MCRACFKLYSLLFGHAYVFLSHEHAYYGQLLYTPLSEHAQYEVNVDPSASVYQERHVHANC